MKSLIARITLLFTLAVTALTFTSHTAWANVDHAGGWSKKSSRINGSWSITGNILTISDDFKTRSGPDLKIFLSTAPLSQLNGNNATSNAILVSPLASASGGQQYYLPAGVDLSQFQSIIIHCEAFSKLWGGAPL